MSRLAQRIRAFRPKGVAPVIALAAALAVPGISDAQSVGGAQVVGPDVQASNGVIHVIDTVLMPPSKAAGN